ncbi:outer membrane beta-barrel protein [Chryseobacterium sp. G0201]|uniref:outer membrane beta-barrel protein n=1 Tax=Chryseobacterium sp. G0201 TaxID=2487065 RepID=UPI000F510A24|nr:outer membrane beta-barrel protein [Chryseobacterium sp. G0201]AZA52552.1 PorT family protein [Chryseobacterium sp. G0201]
MIKKIIMMGFLCALSTSAYSQRKSLSVNLQSKNDTEVSPIVKEKVDEYAKKIDAIIQEEKKLMEAELVTLQSKNLDKTEFDKQKSLIADRFSEKIDTRIEELGFDLDNVIQKQVRYSLLNSDIASNEELKAQLMKKFRPTKSLSGYFSYGIMNLTNNKADNDLDKNLGYAGNFEFGFKLNYQFGRTSPWGLISGIGFSWRTLNIDNNMFFMKDLNANPVLVHYENGLSKSKLRTGYIMVPLGIQYNFSKIKNAGMDVEYRDYNKGFKVGANVYGGVKMATNNIVKGDGISDRDRSNYQVSPFIYGGQFTVSYNEFSIFVKKDFGNFFKNGNFENDKALIFGIALWW